MSATIIITSVVTTYIGFAAGYWIACWLDGDR